MTEEIKPCPFCGCRSLSFDEGSTFRWLAYACSECGMGSETRVQTIGTGTNEEWRERAEQDAIKEWNKRTDPPVQPTDDWNAAIEAAATLVWNNGADIRPVAEAIRKLKRPVQPMEPS